jgi:hypothetical protein
VECRRLDLYAGEGNRNLAQGEELGAGHVIYPPVSPTGPNGSLGRPTGPQSSRTHPTGPWKP